ncbi:ABC transporter substrate-binding protein [Burkholderia stagnalis]|uniref:ABC transporter substrate-binding protein n=1 Tax=Burkholderia stagnalis TaxID=1503054 RepID=UPI00075E79A0|nr:ABC transporter substrate-binding protein [Burkholderia stagnalis]KWI28821.1 iron ABC transporter substrate-binding protein [Burkholderia stagnalis]KWI64985.1 iron ABC transporter substrate-binding protein [Burkholderia stagnalis]
MWATLGAWLCGWLVMHAAHADTRTVTDLAGRQVRIPARVERVLLGEGRLLPALAIVDGDDPTRRLVGMMGDFEQLDPASYAQWLERFPRLKDVPRIGRSQAGSFSDERALALRPQVAIFGLGGGHGPGERDRETLARLEAAGVAIVFVDFRHDPLANTTRSVALLGQVFGAPQRAADFNALWQQQFDLVRTRLKAARPAAPTVFLESRVGLSDDCCETMTGMLGRLLDAAGGENIAKGRVPGEHGTLNPEYLLSRQPDVYIGTAIGSALTLQSAPRRIALGAGVTRDAAVQSLDRALQRPTIAPLRAVSERRAYAIWHHFYNSPFNVVAVQALAKWLHPDLFADLDPRRTFDTMVRRFQPVALNGEYWIQEGS